MEDGLREEERERESFEFFFRFRRLSVSEREERKPAEGAKTPIASFLPALLLPRCALEGLYGVEHRLKVVPRRRSEGKKGRRRQRKQLFR